MMAELHARMDEQIENRRHRFAEAQQNEDTDRQWQLVAAAVEQANIIFHKLQGAAAKAVTGRSKVTFAKVDGDALQGIEKRHGMEFEVVKADWLRQQAARNVQLGNKATSIAMKMLC